MICPDAEINLVPVERPIPIPAYHSPPLFTMEGTAAKVSTLFTIVGLAYNPAIAGNGGLILGFPRLPSKLSNKAVSSPQIYAPAPACTCKSKE